MTPKPWYREPWPWLLMAGPAIVVVAGIATTVIAVTTFDGLVADDYYKQGLGINRVLAREEQARVLGVTAMVQFNAERSRVRVILGPGANATSMRLALVHPTLPASDQAVALAATGTGTYEGAMHTPRPGKMHMRLEDGEGTWRLSGAWPTQDDTVRLAP